MTKPDAIEAYRAWVVDQALPRWAQDGFDHARGRFRERLNPSGAPIDLPHRAMVQARQIFVFADAARRGWYEGGGVLAEQAMTGLLRDYMEEDGPQVSFAFSTASIGGGGSCVRDAYAHAFALFSLAALYRLNGDGRLLDVADRTIRFIDDQMTDRRHGGLHDALPPPASGKRQNPHMHLLEAYLFLHEAASDRGYLDRAAEIVALFEQRFWDEQSGVLLEYFADDWAVHADPQRARLWEPGHHFEWVWLLEQFARARGARLPDVAQTLYDHALRYGLAADGLIVDEVDSVGKHVVRRSSRVWPHTEAIKAAATRHRAADGAATAFASDMAAALMETFLDRPFAGGWIDHVAEDRAPLVDYVPASSLYHLYLAATEADSFLRQSPTKMTLERAV